MKPSTILLSLSQTQHLTANLNSFSLGFSAVLFQFILATSVSSFQGNPAYNHALIYSLFLCGATGTAILWNRLPLWLSFSGLFFLETLLLIVTLLAIPLLYIVSKETHLVGIFSLILSLGAGAFLGAGLTSIYKTEAEHPIQGRFPALSSAALGAFAAAFLYPALIMSGLSHFFLSGLISLLLSLNLFVLVLAYFPALKLSRALWFSIALSALICAIFYTSMSQQVQYTLEFKLYNIYPIL